MMFGHKPAVYDYSMCVMLLSGNQQCGQIKCLLLRINYPYMYIVSGKLAILCRISEGHLHGTK